uniref:EGF-like domain-containing protein n=3 Tax=Eptatretus burgeri TaxID=7764 RepID=A0A8C4PWV9_EPTBU
MYYIISLTTDENECQLPPEFLCGLQANCTNTFGGYYCTCLRGYVSTNMKTTFQPNDGTICVDLDECVEKPTVCGDGGHCSNTLGSYHCSCLPGYKRTQPGLLHPIENETFCIDIDECLENMTACKNGSQCSNSHGSFSCSEPLSHSPKLTSHNTANSKDVAECTQNKTACKKGSRCSNSSGSFSCSDHLSHSPKLTSHKTTNSTDIEECLQNMTACKNGSQCSNSHGSFSCSEPLSHFPKLTSHNKTNSADGAVNGSKDITVLLTIIFSTLTVISFLACLAFFRSLKTKRKSCVVESI